jgi:hypothetical protein
MKTREARFIGHGNFAVGEGTRRIRAWKVTCSRCQTTKVVTTPHGDIPPQALVRKFHQSGWYVGNRPVDDLCGDCQRKQKHASSATQPFSKALATTGTDVVVPQKITETQNKLAEAINREQAARREVMECNRVFHRLHELLIQHHADEALEVIEARFPNWRRNKKQGVAAKPTALVITEDYDQWLAELQKHHDDRKASGNKMDDVAE